MIVATEYAYRVHSGYNGRRSRSMDCVAGCDRDARATMARWLEAHGFADAGEHVLACERIRRNGENVSFLVMRKG